MIRCSSLAFFSTLILKRWKNIHTGWNVTFKWLHWLFFLSIGFFFSSFVCEHGQIGFLLPVVIWAFNLWCCSVNIRTWIQAHPSIWSVHLSYKTWSIRWCLIVTYNRIDTGFLCSISYDSQNNQNLIYHHDDIISSSFVTFIHICSKSTISSLPAMKWNRYEVFKCRSGRQ